MNALTYEEAVHKLLKVQIQEEEEVCFSVEFPDSSSTSWPDCDSQATRQETGRERRPDSRDGGAGRRFARDGEPRRAERGR